jgi:antitoxin YefM
MKVATYTDFRSNPRAYIDAAIDDCDTVIISRGEGKGAAVLLSMDEYDAIVETEYILKSPEMVKRINDAEEEIRQGKGKAINIENHFLQAFPCLHGEDYR